jgi:hypothetical protein
MERICSIIMNADVRSIIPSPAGRRPGRGDINQEELFVDLIPSPQPFYARILGAPDGRGSMWGSSDIQCVVAP